MIVWTIYMYGLSTQLLVLHSRCHNTDALSHVIKLKYADCILAVNKGEP